MAHVEDDGRPLVAPTVAPPFNPDDPGSALQAMYPNLDRVSRSVFRKGTLSRRRINRALLMLVVVAAIVAVLVLVNQ